MMQDPYPVTILASRYGGTYEGATWVAFNDRPDMVDDAMADDITCSNFFRNYEKMRQKPIGRGESPKHAYDDLCEKLKK